jgi:hypothetical protein
MVNCTTAATSKPIAWVFALLTALVCTTVQVSAASLFGDLSCQAWTDLDYSRKKIWTNAFLAPLSLTHQGLKKTGPDRYNDDPNAFEPAIASIDKFCLSSPKLGPAEGAVAYLDGLIGQ